MKRNTGWAVITLVVSNPAIAVGADRGDCSNIGPLHWKKNQCPPKLTEWFLWPCFTNMSSWNKWNNSYPFWMYSSKRFKVEGVLFHLVSTTMTLRDERLTTLIFALEVKIDWFWPGAATQKPCQRWRLSPSDLQVASVLTSRSQKSSFLPLCRHKTP